jgi:hypothetical protein
MVKTSEESDNSALVSAIHAVANSPINLAHATSLGTAGSTLTVAGHLGGMTADYLTFNKSVISGTTGATITQANGATGEGAADHAAAAAYTLIANAVSTFAGDGSGVTLVNLPAATGGTYCVLQITGDIDQTGAFAIQTNAATDVYAHQLIHIDFVGGTAAPAVAKGVQTAGTAAAPTSIELIYTAAAADTNFLGVNSEIFFYCATDGEWLVKVKAVPEGTGATGAFTVA